MKIGYPAAGTTDSSKYLLSKDFVEGGAMGFFDTESGEVEVTPKEQLGKGLIQWVKEKDITAIITPELKAMALRVFREHNISVFKAEGSMLALNVELLKSKSLLAFSLIEMGVEGASCSPSACGSCSSSCN